MLYVDLATEDPVSEAVGKRLLAEIKQPIEILNCYRRNGFGYLHKKMDTWCQIATQRPLILITDLDKRACPAALIKDWSPKNRELPTNLIFRVAVKTIEAWLLADHETMPLLLESKCKKLPLDGIPDLLADPKQSLIDLAEKKASREVRRGLVPKKGQAAKQGLGYNPRLTVFIEKWWDPIRASERSPSLQRALFRLRELGRLETD